MSDKNKQYEEYPDYLKYFIQCWEKSDEPCGAKDLESRFLYANKAYYQLMDLPAWYRIVGKRVSELPVPLSEEGHKFEEHDRLVVKSRRRESSFDVYHFGRNRALSAYMVHKFPLFDRDGNISGTYFSAHIAADTSTLSMQNAKPSAILVTDKVKLFTESEWQVAYLLQKRTTQKDISRILEVSDSSVEGAVHRIYEKIKHRGVKCLLKYIRDNGLLSCIPGRFITKGHMLIKK